jgi:hypothetical protein
MKRSVQPAQTRMLRKRCVSGAHEMTYENTIVGSKGEVRCRACWYARQKEWRDRRDKAVYNAYQKAWRDRRRQRCE